MPSEAYATELDTRRKGPLEAASVTLRHPDPPSSTFFVTHGQNMCFSLCYVIK
jgi:hypothetical protein